MTTTAPHTTGARRRPLAALAKAEYLQFRRNNTLVFMGIGFPVLIPLIPFFIAVKNGDTTTTDMFTMFEMFALMAMLFVQYYSVLSMVTTRRSEGVLKRLRTGEASDWQIQLAPMAPGAILSMVGVVLVGAIALVAGGPMPVNILAIVLAVLGGVIIFSLLALATSAFTKNAEAAQITSLPLMAVSMVGLASIRNILPDGLADVVTWTPFAAISDLVSLGASGKLATAAESSAALDFAGTFAEIGQPLAILAAWSVLALALTRQYFRWDDRG